MPEQFGIAPDFRSVGLTQKPGFFTRYVGFQLSIVDQKPGFFRGRA
jgi:hypothetical protein